MKLSQISLMKDSYMKKTSNPITGKPGTAGAYMRLCLDGGIDFVTSKDLCIFDDGNELVHCISINDTYQSQASYPVKIMSADYEIIQQIETIMSQVEFEKLLDEGFLSSLVSEDQKDFIKRWSKDIRNQAVQPMRPTPYYPQKPAVIPMPNKVLKRHDGIETQLTPATLGLDSAHDMKVVSVSTIDAFKNSITNANDGDTIIVANDMIIDEPLKLDKDVNLITTGATVSAPITIGARSVLLSGFNFEGTSSNKGFAITATKSNTLILRNNKFNLSGYRDAIVANVPNIIIEGNTFDGDGTVYNAIEIGQSVPIKSISICNNVFTENAITNNGICLYSFENNADVKINENYFEKSANAIRLSSDGNASVIINCESNIYASIDNSSPEYIGFILFQGVNEHKDFSNMKVLIKDLTGPGSKKMTSNGTGEDQVWYSYNVDINPTVYFN